MKKLIEQILKFGVVGIVCFFIDFIIYTACNFAGIPYLISGFCGFVVSVVANYILSMKFVFKRREDISRTKEFVVFIILSAIGLGINELMLVLGMNVLGSLFKGFSAVHVFETISKLFATGVVMVWNFVSRKIFLEKKY